MTGRIERELLIAVGEAWVRSGAGELSLAASFSDAFSDAAAVARGLFNLDEFRPSELERYDALLSAAVTQVQREAEVRFVEAVTAALVAFAGEHPDAPRSHT